MARRPTSNQLCIAAPLLLAAMSLAGCATPDRAGPALVAPVAVERAPLVDRVRAALNAPALAGTRWGLLVADDTGREIMSIAPDERFVPASNTKIFTVAAAFMALPGIDAPTPATAVRLEPRASRTAPDVVLVGSGDGTLADRADCASNCLSELADAVARSGVRVVGDVIGDDRLFPDERWGPGWSWNNLQTRSGTAASALSVNDNEVAFTVTPAAVAGRPPTVAWVTGDDYYALRNDAVTVAGGKTDLGVERLPGGRTVRVYGTMPVGAPLDTQRLGVEDPADFAATRFRRLLEAQGVRVTGQVVARHRPLVMDDDPLKRGARPAASPAPVPPLARLDAPSLAADLTRTSKVSQNLHTELLLRRIGLAQGGSGSIADGQAYVRRMLDGAGVARSAYDFSDGSGMSTYNRVSPRAAVRFLRWTMTQPWGAAFRATLPVAGVDGTLSTRFVGTPLAGRLFAKTGTLNGVNALAGFLTTASGRDLTFALYANDRPADATGATDAAEAALVLIAAEN